MIAKSTKEPNLLAPVLGPAPGDFPLCSIESRAAARLRLRHQQDSGSWFTFPVLFGVEGPSSEGPSRITFDPWKEWTNGDHIRVVHVPSAFRMLPAGESNVLADRIPACLDCGTPFREANRRGLLVQFTPACVYRHDPDPAPPPKGPPRQTGFIFDEAQCKAANDIIAKTWEVEEMLAPRLNMHPYELAEIFSGRREPDASLRARIAAELEAGTSTIAH